MSVATVGMGTTHVAQAIEVVGTSTQLWDRALGDVQEVYGWHFWMTVLVPWLLAESSLKVIVGEDFIIFRGH